MMIYRRQISREMAKSLIGGTFKEKLLFVPNADTHPKVQHEISEPALFRFLLKEKTIEAQAEMQAMLNTLSGMDKLSKITKVEIHESSMGSVTDLSDRAVHVFIVFKTCGKDGDYYWWSLEKNTKYIVLQRSRNKNDVKDRLYGEERKKVKTIKDNLTGKGSIKDLFVIVWAYQAISEKYNIVNSNCQSLVKLVSNKITEIEYEFKEFFESILRYINFIYYIIHYLIFLNLPLEKRNMEILDLINILSMCFEKKGHPLFNLIYHEKPDLFDIVMKSGKYDINDTFTDHKITALHLAIVISSPEMVRHILKKWKADPIKRDTKGRTALHLAALCAQEHNLEIIDTRGRQL